MADICRERERERERQEREREGGGETEREGGGETEREGEREGEREKTHLTLKHSSTIAQTALSDNIGPAGDLKHSNNTSKIFIQTTSLSSGRDMSYRQFVIHFTILSTASAT